MVPKTWTSGWGTEELFAKTMHTSTGRACNTSNHHIHATPTSLQDPLLHHGRLCQSLGVHPAPYPDSEESGNGPGGKGDIRILLQCVFK